MVSGVSDCSVKAVKEMRKHVVTESLVMIKKKSDGNMQILEYNNANKDTEKCVGNLRRLAITQSPTTTTTYELAN